MDEMKKMYEDKYNPEYITFEEGPNVKPSSSVSPKLDPALTEEQLASDPFFQEQAEILYFKTLEQKKTAPDYTGFQSVAANHGLLDDPRDIAEWAIGEVAWFRNNMSAMMIDMAKLSKADPDMVVAMHNLNKMYASTPDTGKQFARGVGAAVADPLNVLGITAIAKTAGATSVGKKMASTQLGLMADKIMRQRIGRRSAAATLASAEGAAFSAGTAYGQDSLEANAEGRPVDMNTVRTAGAIGAVAAPILVGTAFGIGAAWRKGADFVQKFKVKRGEGEFGGNSFTDSDVVAQSYADKHENGRVREVEISAAFPATVDKPEISGTELAEQLDLSVDFGSEVKPTSEYLEDPAVIAEIERRGIDMIAFPERQDLTQSDKIMVGAEVFSESSSLDAEHTSTTYKTFGKPEVSDKDAE